MRGSCQVALSPSPPRTLTWCCRTPAFALAALTCAAGLAGWGSSWLLLFWLPVLPLLLLPDVATAWRHRPSARSHKDGLAIVVDKDRGWLLTHSARDERGATPLARQGRAYVTSAFTTAAFTDRYGQAHRIAFTPSQLDPEQRRRLRLALRHYAPGQR